MVRLFTGIFLSLLILGCKDRAEIAENREVEQKKVEVVDSLASISIMVGGDIMFHSPQITAGRSQSGGYDFSDCFKYIKDSWKECDAVVFNLETTLSDSKYSGYPQFAAPKEVAANLKSVGVTHLALANNHCCDKYSKGIDSTVDFCQEMGIETMGVYKDSTSWDLNSPLFIQKHGFNIALLNYTYGTNGLPIPRGKVVGLVDTVQIAKDIEKAKKGFATNILVFIHWGEEYSTTPSAAQKELALWLKEKGVDLIVGSHPHVVQPVEKDSSGITIYSLGNFISNQRKRDTNGGLKVKIEITRNVFTGENLYDIELLPHFVYLAPLGDHPRYYCVHESAADSVILDKSQHSEAKYFFSSMPSVE